MIFRTALIALMAVLAIHLPYAHAQHDSAMWEEQIQKFESMDREEFPPEGAVLFIGSSSIRMWSTLAEDFAPTPVINRGFGGSWIRDSIYFADRIIIPYRPAKIVFYAGENDIAGKEPPAVVLADFERLEALIHDALPDTPIYFVTLKPSPLRWSLWPLMERTNQFIKSFCERREGVYYVDAASAMLKSDGAVRTNIFIEDNLHMNAAGYSIWTSIIKPLISE